MPYDGLDSEDIAHKVIKGEKLKEHVIGSIDIRLADLVETCRAVEPTKRPSFEIIVQVLNEILNSQ